MSRVHAALTKADATRAHGMGVAMDQPTNAQLADELTRKNKTIEKLSRELGEERQARLILTFLLFCSFVMNAWALFGRGA